MKLAEEFRQNADEWRQIGSPQPMSIGDASLKSPTHGLPGQNDARECYGQETAKTAKLSESISTVLPSETPGGW